MKVAITGPDNRDAIQLGPIRMRILEDGSTTDRRLEMGEITLPPIPTGRLSSATPVTTRASMWSLARELHGGRHDL